MITSERRSSIGSASTGADREYRPELPPDARALEEARSLVDSEDEELSQLAQQK